MNLSSQTNAQASHMHIFKNIFSLIISRQIINNHHRPLLTLSKRNVNFLRTVHFDSFQASHQSPVDFKLFPIIVRMVLIIRSNGMTSIVGCSEMQQDEQF